MDNSKNLEQFYYFNFNSEIDSVYFDVLLKKLKRYTLAPI